VIRSHYVINGLRPQRVKKGWLCTGVCSGALGANSERAMLHKLVNIKAL